MFSTKSNAGLDLDTKPPTAEITISRKEAVIEPVFEKGLTPPVLASFKPRVGFGNGFKNYFLGVDQTFAGGDAAKIMATLYDSPTVHTPNVNEPAFDSKLDLTKAPSGSHIWGLNWLTTPAKPGDIRPLVFGTDTLLGLKIAWTGAAGQFPDSVKAGFNRKEFAWAPLITTEDGKSIKMPSFLATIESRIIGGNPTNQVGSTNSDQGAGISSIQYFATGDAAKSLVYQHDVRDAMLSRLDPQYRRTHSARNAVVLRQILDAMNNAFVQLASGDPIAAAFATQFQDLKDIHVPDSFEKAKPKAMHFYTRTKIAPFIIIQAIDKAEVNSPLTLDNLLAYLSHLDTSREALSYTLANLANVQLSVITAAGVAAPKPITPNDAKDLQSQLDIQTAAYAGVEREISDNQILNDGLSHFRSLSK